MPAPLDIQIPSHIDVTAHAGQTVTVPLSVSNLGADKLHVFASMFQSPGWHAVIARTSFMLRPGHHAADSLRFTIPRTASGLTDLHVKFAAAPIGHGGGIRVAGGVADTIAVNLPKLAPPVAHNGSIVTAVAVLALIAVLSVLAVFTGRWLRHRSEVR